MDSSEPTRLTPTLSPGERTFDRLLWVGLTLALTLPAAAALAQLPALRRPLLTALAAGIACGGLARGLARWIGLLATPRGGLVPMFAVLLLLSLTHLLVFRDLRQAAERRTAEHPEELRMLEILEHAPEPEAPAAARERRLRVRPEWSDYLAHRISPFWQAPPAPWPLVLAMLEGLAAVAAAGWTYARAGSPPRERTGTSREPGSACSPVE